ncbi:Quinone oxidoreductase [Acidisarcina polymorpha]|uniref:Quinone oxidoreductase n=1 Tax=Acidisarcina polymorpha TaxID=2211140 RepID=A0A2Z5FZX8_9BACT|nr:zinc-dependent alcohol dehydrogenase family protein [Acidisarcina polymorpha]AXC12339.1 Quinone oxidoreductase [Acidisarcina polymorpha]
MPRIVRLYEFGGPEKLQLEDAPSQQPGKDEVKLRVQATGLNRAEAMYMRGSYYGDKPSLPSRIGFEAAGKVEAVGPGVDPVLIGRQVSTMGGFSQGQYGVLGEEAIVPVSAIAEYPGSFSPEQGASIWIAYLTAWGALIHDAGVTSGDFVVIPAASSSVGLAAIQIAKDAGAVAIATTRTAEKQQEVLALGADHVIATEEEDLPARVREITGGLGSRVIFDPVGGPYVESLPRQRPTAQPSFSMAGSRDNPRCTPSRRVSKGLSLRGYTMTEVRGKQAVLDHAQSYIRERLQDGRFVPKIAKTFPLEQSADAYRFLESSSQVGKVVITV